MDGLRQAILQWQGVIGTAFVTSEPSQLNLGTTFLTSKKILAVLRPGTTEEIQACLRIANLFNIPVYPVSRGRNCGYGSKVPYKNNSVVLELDRLNRIFNYDPELGSVRIEPGVTQRELCDFLAEEGGKHWMDPVPTFPDNSVLGNILERGHGMTAYGDRVSFACDYEVILPTGEKIVTGYSAFPGARTAGMDRWSAGPQLDGMFSQSNLGIVTRMTLWLMPAPEYVKLLAFPLNSHEAFVLATDSLRPLRLDGTLRYGPRFFNEHRLIQTYSKYPWDRMQGKTPLSEELTQQLMKEMGVPLWTGIVAFFGSRDQVAAGEKRVFAALKNLAPEYLSMDEDIYRSLSPMTGFERYVHTSFNNISGRVHAVTARPRWRKKISRQTATSDWFQEACGIILCPVTVPFRGKDALIGSEIYRRIVGSYGFEPDMSVSAIRDRTLEFNASIVFDREDIEEEKRALSCARALMMELARNGYHPNRVGLPTMFTMNGVDPQLQETFKKISKALDPNQILAPGRYIMNQNESEGYDGDTLSFDDRNWSRPC